MLTEESRLQIYLDPEGAKLPSCTNETLALSEQWPNSHLDWPSSDWDKPQLFWVDRSISVSDLFLLEYQRQSDRAFAIKWPHLLMAHLSPIVFGLATAQISEEVLVAVGDSTFPVSYPHLGKARRINAPGCRFLAPIKWERHFGPLHQVAAYDCEWEEKSRKLAWRGTFWGSVPERPWIQSRLAIPRFVRETKGSEEFNVGFSVITEGKLSEAQELGISTVSHMHMGELLRFRYLLCLEGHDVASGLKWMLLSNSLVLMPEPTIESWFCESALRPWEHYVPVNPDLSDLADKVSWCNDNSESCRQISANASAFAQSFLDIETEERLFHTVLRNYVEGNAVRP